MSTEHLAVVRGWSDTRAALRAWRARPAATLLPWAAGALAVAALLLCATWLVALLNTPRDPWIQLGSRLGGWSDLGWILYRNGLVLALHALACVAGFIARSSLPREAQRYHGWWRRVHDHAGRLAIAFVCGATLFSLSTQAYALGLDAAEGAAQRGMSITLFMLALLPHAIPELCALFLPLAAWLAASRRGAWHELLAATFVTTAIAVPVLLASAAWEVWVAPHLL